jgi:hypothetical protein
MIGTKGTRDWPCPLCLLWLDESISAADIVNPFGENVTEGRRLLSENWRRERRWGELKRKVFILI